MKQPSRSRDDSTTIVSVEPFSAADSTAVRRLLIDGLTERWGTYEAHFNPDIESFPLSYVGSTILVAKQCEQIVGTGILKATADDGAHIVRMSVAASHRRCGIGSRILRRLIAVAGQQGIRELTLETSTSWTSAVDFYVRCGFRKTRESGGDTYFAYTLGVT